jgi:hypothetical protein
MADLLVADQGMLLKLCSLFIMKWFICAKKLPGLVLCNLQFFAMPKKTTLRKNFTRRIMRSAIPLFVLDFS